MSKIIFNNNSLHGLTLFRKDVYDSYAKDGVEVVLVAPKDCEFQSEYSNIRFIPVTMHSAGTNPIEDFRYFMQLLKIYREEKPDYIFHYTIKPNIYGSIAAKLCEIPSTVMVAGLGSAFNGGLKNDIIVCLYRFALQFPEHVLVLNQYNKEVLLNRKIVKNEKLIWLHGGEGINLEKFKAQ